MNPTKKSGAPKTTFSPVNSDLGSVKLPYECTKKNSLPAREQREREYRKKWGEDCLHLYEVNGKGSFADNWALVRLKHVHDPRQDGIRFCGIPSRQTMFIPDVAGQLLGQSEMIADTTGEFFRTGSLHSRGLVFT